MQINRIGPFERRSEAITLFDVGRSMFDVHLLYNSIMDTNAVAHIEALALLCELNYCLIMNNTTERRSRWATGTTNGWLR
jgi:hypothetical protein